LEPRSWTVGSISNEPAHLGQPIEWLVDHVPLSLFQPEALALLIATNPAEFLLTVWIRFVINRRTIAIDSV
jgi:hypothetical protein